MAVPMIAAKICEWFRKEMAVPSWTVDGETTISAYMMYLGA